MKIRVEACFAAFTFCLGGVINFGFAGKLRAKQIAQANSPQGSSPAGLNGKTLYVQKACQTCHGPEGRKSIMDVYPNLAGQKFDYLFQQSKDIKSGARSNGMSAAMKALTATASVPELKAIADYLSRLSPSYPSKKATHSVAEGKKLYRSKLCHTCHGERAKTPIAKNYPALAGQNETYLAQQLLDMKSGKRKNGLSPAMTPFLGMASEKELKSIAQYLSSVKG